MAGVATLGTIGLAAGISTGDMSNAIAGVTGGIVAGNRLGNRTIETAKNVGGSARNIRDTFREGMYGEKEAKKLKDIKEFKKTAGYKKLLEKFPASEEKINKILNAGIMDTKKIKMTLNNSNNYSTDNAIAYMNMAKLCPNEIFEDRDKFNTYLESHGIPKEKATEIYRAVKEYR